VYRILPQRVNVFLFRGDVHFDFVTAFSGGFDDAEVGGDFVVTFCTPGDVVDVCELEGGEKGGCKRRGEEGGSGRLTA
jgi:hypothetical protein